MCAPFRALDDDLAPILEDIEFYQISLTTDDNADVSPELALTNVFIEDNDGKLLLMSEPTVKYSLMSMLHNIFINRCNCDHYNNDHFFT